MRSGVTDQELKDQFKALWNMRRPLLRRTNRTNRSQPQTQKINMNYIGVRGPSKEILEKRIDGQCKLGLGFPTPKSRGEYPLKPQNIALCIV